MTKALLIILLLLFFGSLFSQKDANFRIKSLHLSGDTVVLDSLSIVPESEIIYDKSNKIVSKEKYKILYAEGFIIPDLSLKGLTVEIKYRTFPINFTKEYYHKDINETYFSGDTIIRPYVYTYRNPDNEDIFSQTDLNRRGSISRGISFGNNQDIIVNSSLNLQLSGKVSENLSILAAISDNNIPIQPDGNTQQIQEFDKVYITLFNENNKLTVGDFEIGKPTGHYMNMYKKVQGGNFSTNVKLNKDRKTLLKSSISGAVSKGKYNRQLFSGEEGNQGPYKLRGADNETYIIVLAGTEKVYVDGRLQRRGQDNDYIIDYNTAEITFTPNQTITKDKRIIIEFEYSDKSYARFLVHNSNELKTEKGNFWLNIFSESDSKNQTIQQDLEEEDKSLLFQIGDSIHNAYILNIDSIEFDNDIVLYRMVDTIVSGIGYDSIFIHSTNPDSAFYRLGFTDVGENNGNYIQIQSAANGRVFEWVAPVNGIRQGRYEPIILLVTPKKKQMLSFGGIYALTKSTEANFEFALTNNDINTFSTRDRGNDIGYALKAGFTQQLLKDTAKTKFHTSVNYQIIDQYFDPIDRFRNPEFERDWNLDPNKNYGDEHFINYNLTYQKNRTANIAYDLEYMEKRAGLSALRNNVLSAVSFNGFKFDFSGSYLSSEGTINKTSFLRHKASVSKSISFFKIGLREEQEENRWTQRRADTLLPNSFSFNLWEVFLENNDTSKNKFFTSYKNRNDYLPYNNRLRHATNSEDLNLGFQLNKNPKNIFRSVTTYRRLVIIDSLISSNESENTLTSRFEHSGKFIKNLISTNTFYEIGSGMEIKREFSYLEVSPGQGVYKWSDYNENGIKELDEFDIANFSDEAAFIRVFTPTNSYIKTYSNQFSQMIYIRPDRVWRNSEGFKKLISRFSEQFAYRANQKTLQEDIYNSVNPFRINVNDSVLISMGASVRNVFAFNKTSSKYSIEYIYQQNQSKTLLINGIDSRTLLSNGVQLRWNINRYITLLDNFSLGEKQFHSEYFNSKNYLIVFNKNETSIRFQPTMSFRINLLYKYAEKLNSSGDEKAFFNDAGVEVKYNVVKKGSFSAQVNYIKILFKDNTNTPVAYEMLEGLLPGNNGTWTVLYQQNLSTSLQMNINYNGRVSEGSKVIHMAGVQMRAYF